MKISSIEEARALVGRVVMKSSGKPFKSTKKTATISGVRFSLHTGRGARLAFTFKEDDSTVEVERCELIEADT